MNFRTDYSASGNCSHAATRASDGNPGPSTWPIENLIFIEIYQGLPNHLFSLGMRLIVFQSIKQRGNQTPPTFGPLRARTARKTGHHSRHQQTAAIHSHTPQAALQVLALVYAKLIEMIFYLGFLRLTGVTLAERVGFEPTVRLHVQQFSRLPQSATLAPLLGSRGCAYRRGMRARQQPGCFSGPALPRIRIDTSPSPAITRHSRGWVSLPRTSFCRYRIF